MSKLYFRYGAMNSGKSTNLMQVAYNYEERGMRVLLIKPSTDKKGGDKLVSRLGVERKVDLLIDDAQNIYDEVNKWQSEKYNIDCILVDEVQFFKANQIDELFKVAVCLDIPVICYGLRTDFKMEGFEGSTRLLLLAHSIEELELLVYLQYYEIEEHMKQIEKIERKNLLDDNLFQLLFARHF